MLPGLYITNIWYLLVLTIDFHVIGYGSHQVVCLDFVNKHSYFPNYGNKFDINFADGRWHNTADICPADICPRIDKIWLDIFSKTVVTSTVSTVFREHWIHKYQFIRNYYTKL